MALRYATRINGLTGLVVTKLDVLTGIDPLHVAVRYLGPEGATFDEFPYHQSILHKARGDLVELPGWHEDISGVPLDRRAAGATRSPTSTSSSDFLGIPIVMVGVGPARDEMIWTGAAERLRPARRLNRARCTHVGASRPCRAGSGSGRPRAATGSPASVGIDEEEAADEAEQQPLDDELAQEGEAEVDRLAVSRTTRMPTICLPQVWPLWAPPRAISSGA